MAGNKWLDRLPQHWRKRLAVHLQQDTEHFPKISASDFKSNLRLSFEDGSQVFFKYAFHLIAEEEREIAVFTEHCGYHVFPLGGTEIEIVS